MDKLDLNSFTKEQIAMASQCETQKHLMRLLGVLYLPCAILINHLKIVVQQRCTNDKYLIYISLP